MRHVLALGLVAMVAGSATASATSYWQPVDNASALSDYVTFDWVAQTDSAWTSSEMLITLSAGEIFQQPVELGGSDFAPDPAQFAVPGFEALPFDTYLTAGLNSMGAKPTVTAGAVDLGGGAAIQFDSRGVNVTWAGLEGGAVGELILARLTVSKDARGTWAIRMGTSGDFPLYQSGSVADLVAGRPVVPGYIDNSVTITTPGSVPGDCTGDGLVNCDDLSAIIAHWGQTFVPPDYCEADLTGEGFVGGDDLDIVRLHWGVPEPSALVLLLSAGLLLGFRFRRP